MGPDVTIQELLQAWGKSRTLNDAYHLDYPHQTNFAREIRTPGEWASKVPELPVTLALQVDKEVSELKLRKGRRYKAIVLAYVKGFRDGDLAKYFHCSRQKAREYRIAGECWLEARLL